MPGLTHRLRRPSLRTRTGLVGGVVLLALVGAGCGTSDPSAPAASPSSSTTSAASSGTPAAATFNAADVRFAQMMIPHHRQAVQMSDLLLNTSGVPAATLTLARQIKAAQAPEITTMSGWLTAWGQPTAAPMAMGPDDGMMTSAQLKQLDDATGAEARRLYLTGMIKHHQGAVAMAETELDQGADPDAVQLALSVVQSQSQEITTMQKMLAQG